ncbi:hypothetical protein BJY01DRAFT_214183 [Aspergillus pseudoustus]|uniref:Oxidoreductase n=1 Tax=Aspergillus pseudoustus TaxID=1810923 RepID=A0ABR4JZQ7_9EURO
MAGDRCSSVSDTSNAPTIMATSNLNKPLRTVLITGCSDGGIGSALAQEFHERGFHVFATARSAAKMEHLGELPSITLIEMDVESQSSIEDAFKTLVASTGGGAGRLDYLVNNAGLNLNFPALDTDLAYAKCLFDVNFWGMVHVTHTFMPLLISSKGTIVNNASLAGVLNVPWGSFYNASKAAVRMYSETLRVEVAPLGVKVVTIMTGIVASKMFENTPHDELPESSYYRAAGPNILETSTGTKFASVAMPAVTYAKGVVGDVLRGHSGMTWRGKIASLGWFIHSFFPTWLSDLAFGSGSGLEKL